jgi:hypothetical protein
VRRSAIAARLRITNKNVRIVLRLNGIFILLQLCGFCSNYLRDDDRVLDFFVVDFCDFPEEKLNFGVNMVQIMKTMKAMRPKIKTKSDKIALTILTILLNLD